MSEFCTGCGGSLRGGDHTECRRRQQATDPPHFCARCGRKLVVQVLPVSWRARCVRCGEMPAEGQIAANSPGVIDSDRSQD